VTRSTAQLASVPAASSGARCSPSSKPLRDVASNGSYRAVVTAGEGRTLVPAGRWKTPGKPTASEGEAAMNQSPILLHVWSVDPGEETTLVEQLGKMLGRLDGDPGLVSARILASADGTSVAALIEMKSVEDRQRLEELPEVRETLLGVRGAYNLVIRLYHEVEAYGSGTVA
jgi:hypothetical protein